MSDERAFIDHIIAHPDDDAPRLVFADWLDERGRHARAEFIRVQCERARLPDWDARWARLSMREGQLFRRLDAELAAELPDLPERPTSLVQDSYHRGFLASLCFHSFAALRDRLSAWAVTVPLEGAMVLHWWRDGGELEAVPGLRMLALRHGGVDEEDAACLADSPLLRTLHTLSIEFVGIGEPALRRLLASPHLRGLRVLRVRNQSATNCVPRLLADTDLPLLAELDLSGAVEYAEDPADATAALADLAAWPGLAAIRSLTLDDHAAGPSGPLALLASPHAVGLKSLSVRASLQDDDACAAFTEAPPGLRLDVLDIGNNTFGDAGAVALARAECLSELKVLRVDRCEIGPAGAAGLAGAPFMATLRMLHSRGKTFGDDGLRALLAAAPPHLHTLDLSGNDIGADGAAALASSPASGGFLDIDLSANTLTSNGLRSLGESPHLWNLVRLWLSPLRCPGTDWEAFRQSPLGRRLGDELIEVYSL